MLVVLSTVTPVLQHDNRCRFASFAELTLLIVTVVTVVPAVLVMVLGIVPEAPIELCHDTTSQLVLLKLFNEHIQIIKYNKV